MVFIPLLGAATLLILFVSGNNASACVGNLIGARVVSLRSALALEVIGVSAGLGFQGNSMVSAAVNLSDGISQLLITMIIGVTAALFVGAHYVRIPVSLTYVLPMLLVGVSLSFGSYFLHMLVLWTLAPLAALLITPVFTKKLAAVSLKNVWSKVQISKALLLVTSFLFAFVLGANTVGLIVGVEGFNFISVSFAVAAVILGTLFFSAGEIRRISIDVFNLGYTNAMSSMLSATILVEISTLIGVPMSNTVLQTTGVISAGMSYKDKFFSLKPFVLIIASWFLFPGIAAAAGVILHMLL